MRNASFRKSNHFGSRELLISCSINPTQIASQTCPHPTAASCCSPRAFPVFVAVSYRRRLQTRAPCPGRPETYSWRSMYRGSPGCPSSTQSARRPALSPMGLAVQSSTRSPWSSCRPSRMPGSAVKGVPACRLMLLPLLPSSLPPARLPVPSFAGSNLSGSPFHSLATQAPKGCSPNLHGFLGPALPRPPPPSVAATSRSCRDRRGPSA